MQYKPLRAEQSNDALTQVSPDLHEAVSERAVQVQRLVERPNVKIKNARARALT